MRFKIICATSGNRRLDKAKNAGSGDPAYGVSHEDADFTGSVPRLGGFIKGLQTMGKKEKARTQLRAYHTSHLRTECVEHIHTLPQPLSPASHQYW